MDSRIESRNLRQRIYRHPDKFIHQATDKIMTENRDSPDRDYLGVDRLQQSFSKIGLPSPFIDQSVSSEKQKSPESSAEIRQNYENFCQQADQEVSTWDHRKIQEVVVSLVSTYQKEGILDNLPAGHDLGHYLRDIVNALRIYEGLKDQAASRTDLLAGIIGGLFHDTGLAITERYQDSKRAVAHAETGALKFLELSNGLIPDSLRHAISYGISAHTHVLNDKSISSSNYLVKPYWDEIWENPDGKIFGLAWRIPRLTDRLDCNGVSFFIRNIVSKEDPKNETGVDYSGQSDHPLSKIYPQVLKPILRSPEEVDRDKGFTALEHPRNFAKSNDGTTPYSKDDFRYNGYQDLMSERVSETKAILEIEPDNSLVVTDELKNETYQNFLKLTRKIMCLRPEDPKYSEVFDRLENHWHEVVDTNDDYVRRWAAIVPKMNEIYDSWLNNATESAKNSDFEPLLNWTLDKLLV